MTQATAPTRIRQQLSRALREQLATERLDGVPTDRDRLHWLEAEAEQLRQAFHTARQAYLASTRLPLDAMNERHEAWVAMDAAALEYALAADFAVMARNLGDAVS